MPAEFHLVHKYCEGCGGKLNLRNNRDILRKRFCSKQCLFRVVYPSQYVPPISKETREKMRQSKVELLASGWETVGWKKYGYKRSVTGRGYVFLGHRREHRVLMERELGRKLFPYEVVHHKDENKGNNNIENLEVMNNGEHKRLHIRRIMANVTPTI